MKQLVVLILGFILGALAMYFYCCNQESEEITDPAPPKGLIKPAEITALTQAYNPRYQVINDSLFKDVEGGDNRSSWYAIEDVESFLALAKIQAGDLGYTMDGIRIYPGAHPAADKTPGYSTFLMVPTGYKNSSEGSMFFFQKGGGDVVGGNGLNNGDNGDPPGANYPQ